MKSIHRLLITALTAVVTVITLTLGTATPAQAAGGGNVSIWWDFNGGPTSSNDIAFPLTVEADTAHVEGTYFAQQFNFTGSGPVAYTGLQPMADTADGKPQMRALFSSFDGTSTSSHPNCSDGADGGGGTTCRVVFTPTYGHTYNMVVSKVATDTWRGRAVDSQTGASVEIGQWKIPGSGALRTGQVGFVEYYTSVPGCKSLSHVNVVFGAPFTSSGAVGRTGSGGEYSDCVGQTTFSATPVGAGVRIIRGDLNSAPFRLINPTTGTCLDDFANAGRTPGAWTCNGGDNQRWGTTASGQLRNGNCLDARYAGTKPGTQVILYPCHGRSNQQWRLNSNGTITGVGSRLCVNAVGGSATSGAKLELNLCDGRPSSIFKRS